MADDPVATAATKGATMDKWRKRLAPFDQAYSALMQSIYDHVHAADDDELQQIIKDCDEPTGTNCGWTVYRVAKLVRAEATDEQMIRARIKADDDAVRRETVTVPLDRPTR